jgi:hypothetical protein
MSFLTARQRGENSKRLDTVPCVKHALNKHIIIIIILFLLESSFP